MQEEVAQSTMNPLGALRNLIYRFKILLIQHPRQRLRAPPQLSDPRACVLLILADSRPFSCPRQTPFLAAYRTKNGFILLSRPSTLRCR